VDLFADYRDVEMKIQEIRRIEHVGDEMTHAIMRKLNQTFHYAFDGKIFTNWRRRSMTFLDFLQRSWRP